VRSCRFAGSAIVRGDGHFEGARCKKQRAPKGVEDSRKCNCFCYTVAAAAAAAVLFAASYDFRVKAHSKLDPKISFSSHTHDDKLNRPPQQSNALRIDRSTAERLLAPIICSDFDVTLCIFIRQRHHG
jgi:hypothetical protein